MKGKGYIMAYKKRYSRVKKPYQKYTAEQKANYHKSRLHNDKVSVNKVIYSRGWLNGFNDDNPSEKLTAIRRDIEKCEEQRNKHIKELINLKGRQRGLYEKFRLTYAEKVKKPFKEIRQPLIHAEKVKKPYQDPEYKERYMKVMRQDFPLDFIEDDPFVASMLDWLENKNK